MGWCWGMVIETLGTPPTKECWTALASAIVETIALVRAARDERIRIRWDFFRGDPEQIRIQSERAAKRPEDIERAYTRWAELDKRM